MISKQIDQMFDEHGPQAILIQLARRLGEESAIARGEGRVEDSHKYSGFASDCELLSSCMEE